MIAMDRPIMRLRQPFAFGMQDQRMEDNLVTTDASMVLTLQIKSVVQRVGGLLTTADGGNIAMKQGQQGTILVAGVGL